MAAGLSIYNSWNFPENGVYPESILRSAFCFSTLPKTPGIFGTLGRSFLELSQPLNFAWWTWRCSASGLSRKRPEKRLQVRFPPRRILLDIDDEGEDAHEEDHKDDKDDKDEDNEDENEDGFKDHI